jgi:hypothetical protein
MSAEEEDRLDFGEDDEDRESEISLGANGDDEQAADAAGEVEIATEDSANARESRVKYDDDANKDNDGAESPLPAGWQRRYSRNNELYYFNKTANVTTWDRPSTTATLEEDVEMAQEAQTPVVEDARDGRRASVPSTVEGNGRQSLQQQQEAAEAEADKEKGTSHCDGTAVLSRPFATPRTAFIDFLLLASLFFPNLPHLLPTPLLPHININNTQSQRTVVNPIWSASPFFRT